MSAVTIKTAIKGKLDQLVTGGVLKGAEIMDLKKDILDAEIPTFPYAYLMPPSIESTTERADNRSVIRSYNYDILIVWKPDNLPDDTTIEDNIEAILSAFDNDPTLGGIANAGILPISSAPAPFHHAGRDLIGTQVQIQARQLVQLTF